MAVWAHLNHPWTCFLIHFHTPFCPRHICLRSLSVDDLRNLSPGPGSLTAHNGVRWARKKGRRILSDKARHTHTVLSLSLSNTHICNMQEHRQTFTFLFKRHIHRNTQTSTEQRLHETSFGLSKTKEKNHRHSYSFICQR